MKKTVNVVAAIIENENKEILCALRSKNMTIGSSWEFPGGKIEEGETISDAIIREIHEELDCTVEFLNIYHENTHEYDNFIVNLVCTKCRLVSGVPTASEHAKLIWLPAEYLKSLVWAPADIPAMEQLVKDNKEN